ncbi:hypothetical protein L484_014626 [Morus notabilis]|uniref:Uncharacterized protein n=1 Tax=Morus notabilis TaxID=981085 RepID=W9QYU5_9ROSA|nr:hypothetical protein L484_014626 [Morus notabilis]
MRSIKTWLFKSIIEPTPTDSTHFRSSPNICVTHPPMMMSLAMRKTLQLTSQFSTARAARTESCCLCEENRQMEISHSGAIISTIEVA